MANTIKIKNSGTASAVPSALEYGELGLNYADGKIFYKNSLGVISEFTVDAGKNSVHASVAVVQVNGIGTATYTAGSTGADGGTGVGAYIEPAANGALGVVDGYQPVLNDRILFTNNADPKTNGIYKVTSVGSVSTKWRVTRAVDFNNNVTEQVAKGDFTFVINGTNGAGKTYMMISAGTGTSGSIIIGTDNIEWTEVGSGGAATDLDGLTDVVISSPLQFQGLMYDGTNWVNSNIPNTYLVRNNTGSTLLKGTLVGAVGAEPSGRIDVAPFEVTGEQDSELRAMGIVASNISNGVNGEVISFGTLTGLDTRGSTASPLAVGDETWAAGDMLFAHPTVDGKLTNVRPQQSVEICYLSS
jgi:hypothetical protein